MKAQHILRAGSLWYPIMLAQERGELSHSKAAELLGLNLEAYREQKEAAIEAIIALVNSLPSELTSLLAVLRDQPEWFDSPPSPSSSSGTDAPSASSSIPSTTSTACSCGCNRPPAK